MPKTVEITALEQNMIFYSLEDRIQEAKRSIARDPSDTYKIMYMRQMVELQRKVTR